MDKNKILGKVDILILLKFELVLIIIHKFYHIIQNNFEYCCGVTYCLLFFSFYQYIFCLQSTRGDYNIGIQKKIIDGKIVFITLKKNYLYFLRK